MVTRPARARYKYCNYYNNIIRLQVRLRVSAHLCLQKVLFMDTVSVVGLPCTIIKETLKWLASLAHLDAAEIILVVTES